MDRKSKDMWFGTRTITSQVFSKNHGIPKQKLAKICLAELKDKLGTNTIYIHK